ncbi:MerR family transcriptional regulator [Paeniglutamicibacter cryotolerans]|uniref:DNA-binding transcriptional MerR regulator n=1 Tax=Paeniglutamicibacter cryotolerans TaxID=670079 RepID=A0A839QP81_9MICC|nr:TipAS antibiotic-recognition domain-containing protein [Paeniglutamicibacter cryotolerans]MBB2996584.1 DNA-binding transcriptional MerR regulator [Paeniglutamicibacter cryotolerans]
MSQDNVEYGIGDLARHAGITSRALRHYHSLGLLLPSRTAPNGYRYYGGNELLRLQRILLLRDLGLGLDAIAGVLDGQTDTVPALRVHRKWLDAERRRLAQMSRTVDATIAALEQGEAMSAKDMYRGFEPNPYEDEALTRWGDAAVEDSNRQINALGPEGRSSMLAEHESIAAELAACLDAGLPVDGARTQAAVARHHAWVSLSWTPGRDAYIGLGEMYVSDGRFTAAYDRPKGQSARDGVAAYLCSAMAVHARTDLS